MDVGSEEEGKNDDSYILGLSNRADSSSIYWGQEDRRMRMTELEGAKLTISLRF